MQDSEKNTIMRNEFKQNIKYNVETKTFEIYKSMYVRKKSTICNFSNNLHRILSGCASNINYSRL